MSLYRELATVAAGALAQADRFYAHASAFPERLRRMLREYLDAPNHVLVCRRGGDGPAWEWPELIEPFEGADLDPDGYITFAISITLDLVGGGGPLGGPLIINPAFKFKPIRGGIELFVLERRSDGALVDTDHFEISDDNTSWNPLLERCVVRWREMLAFDPYGPADRSYKIGFDVLRPAKGA